MRQTPQFREQRVGFDPDIVSAKRVHEFHRHWQELRAGRELPAKSDFDPTAVPHLLSGIMLLRVHEDPLDFEYRIIGEDVVARFGSLKGKRVRDGALLNPSTTALGHYCAVVEARRPHFLEGVTRVAWHDRPIHLSRVHCPLSADGKKIDHIISYVAFL